MVAYVLKRVDSKGSYYFYVSPEEDSYYLYRAARFKTKTEAKFIMASEPNSCWSLSEVEHVHN